MRKKKLMKIVLKILQKMKMRSGFVNKTVFVVSLRL